MPWLPPGEELGHDARPKPFVGRPAHVLPHFEGHVQWGTTRSRRRRRPCGDGISLPGALDLDDPITRQKLLRLRKYAVRDRSAVLPGPHTLGLRRAGQAFVGHHLAGLAESLVQANHERDVRLDILFRPGGHCLIARTGAVHLSECTSSLLLLSISALDLCAFTEESEQTGDSPHRRAQKKKNPAGFLCPPGRVVPI